MEVPALDNVRILSILFFLRLIETVFRKALFSMVVGLLNRQ
jgi:hypothetical protein